MTKQTFKIFIAGVEYSTYISYPVSITEKNLDESLNLATVSLKHTTNAAPFKPNRQVELRVYVDTTLTKTYYFLLLNDIVEKIGVTNYYNHKLSLIEYTQVLENIILPDMTITRVEPYWKETTSTSFTISGIGSDPYIVFGEPETYTNNTIGRLEYPNGSGVYKYFKSFIGYLPTLLDVANKILDEVYHLTGYNYTKASATEVILNNVLSPEWTFTRMTALEALRMVFSMAKIVPIMGGFNNVTHVGLLDTSETTKMNPFVVKSEAYDPQTYKTALYSNVENFIAGPETIIEPANGWLTPRSPDGFEISNENAIITTSRPIYKVEKLEAKPYRFAVRGVISSTFYWTYVLFDDLQALHPEWIKYIDLTEVLYEEGVYNTLENKSEYGKRGGSLYYIQGKPNIIGLTSRAPTKWTWQPSRQAIRVILENNISDIPPSDNYTLAINPDYYTDFTTYMTNLFITEHGEATYDIYNYYVLYEGQNGFQNLIGSIGTEDFRVYNTQFRVTYTPYVTTNIFTFRERYDAADEVQSYQTYNQTANVVDRDVLADLHDKVIKRGSGSGLDYTFLHKNWTELPTIGKRFGDYIITSADYTINQYGIQSTYNIDKYYQKLQKYVAVLEKWRQFSIPNEGVVRRQYTINNFAKFSTSSIINTSNFEPNMYQTTTNEVRLIQITPVIDSEPLAFTIPATSFAFNNALIFEGTPLGNANVGMKSLAMDTGDTNYDDDKRRDEPYIYTDENGFFDIASIGLYGGYSPAFITLANSYEIPEFSYMDNSTMSFYALYESVKKDAREILSISVQLHHIDTTNKFYINPGWTKRNGLVGGVGINTNIKLAYLNFKPFNTTDATGHIISSTAASHTYNAGNRNYSCPHIQNTTAGSPASSWAIIDGTTNEILYWCDEEVPYMSFNTQYVINFDSNY